MCTRCHSVRSFLHRPIENENIYYQCDDIMYHMIIIIFFFTTSQYTELTAHIKLL